MLEATEREGLRKGMKTAWIIWGAMLGSLALYLALCEQLGNLMDVSMLSDAPLALLKSIFYCVAAAELIIAYFVRRFMLSGRLPSPVPDLRQQAWNVKTSPSVAKYIPGVLVSLAIAESVGIYGLIIFFLGGDFKTLYTFLFISAVAIIFFRPKFEELEQLAVSMKVHA